MSVIVNKIETRQTTFLTTIQLDLVFEIILINKKLINMKIFFIISCILVFFFSFSSKELTSTHFDVCTYTIFAKV